MLIIFKNSYLLEINVNIFLGEIVWHLEFVLKYSRTKWKGIDEIWEIEI
jgi:hypothetical protein